MSDSQVTKTREIQLKSVRTFQETYSDKGSHQKKTTEIAINELSAELEKLKEEKQELLKHTKKVIEEERNEWEKEKHTYIEAAKKEGYEAGIEIGKNESIETYKALIEKANTIVRQTETDYYDEMEHHGATIAQLAVVIAGKIIHERLEEKPESFINIVNAALRELKEVGRITIYLHPDNHKYVQQQKDELTGLLEDSKKISIYADESLEVHSCIIKHPYGQIDANIDTQLDQIRSVLSDVASGDVNGDK